VAAKAAADAATAAEAQREVRAQLTHAAARGLPVPCPAHAAAPRGQAKRAAAETKRAADAATAAKAQREVRAQRTQNTNQGERGLSSGQQVFFQDVRPVILFKSPGCPLTKLVNLLTQLKYEQCFMVSGEYPYLVKLPSNDEGEATWGVNAYKQLIRSFIFKKDAPHTKSCPTDTKVHFEKFILSNAATSQNSFAARVARAAVELGVLPTREYGYEKLNNMRVGSADFDDDMGFFSRPSAPERVANVASDSDEEVGCTPGASGSQYGSFSDDQSQDFVGEQHRIGSSPSFGSESELDLISSCAGSQNDIHPIGDGADLASSADAESVDYFGLRLSRVHVELLNRWITPLMKAKSVTHQPSQKAAKKFYWKEVPHDGTHDNKARVQRAELTLEFAKTMFDAHCRAQYRDGGHGASLYERMATDNPGQAARVLLNNPTEPETASFAQLIQRIIPMCLEFEAEESERDSWKDTSVGVKPGAKDISINGLCTKPTSAKGKQELHRALTGIVMEGETGTYTFQRGGSEKRTINIVAQKCNKLLSILGAPNEVRKIVNEVEGHRPTYVGATDSMELTEPYVIIRATQDYGCQTHANLTRIFEAPGSAEKLTSIHVLYVVMGAMSGRLIDRVEKQLTTILGTNPLSSYLQIYPRGRAAALRARDA
jgi:hypothetical protein